MFLRSLLIYLSLWLAMPASATETVVLIDRSSSAGRYFLPNDNCQSIFCGMSLAQASRFALAEAVLLLPDPICGGRSQLVVAGWSTDTAVISGWHSVATAQSRQQFADVFLPLSIHAVGGTTQRQAVAWAVDQLNSVQAEFGTILVITDNDVRSDIPLWQPNEGYAMAEEAGYQYQEILVTGRTPVSTLTSRIHEVLYDLHLSPFLCLG